jgi:hypothetical protein
LIASEDEARYGANETDVFCSTGIPVTILEEQSPKYQGFGYDESQVGEIRIAHDLVADSSEV